MRLPLTLLRLVVGGLFVGHGTQKLFGWFGGHGVEATGGFFESLGLQPGKRQAVAAGASEAGGGALLMIGGPAAPLGCAALSAVMITAIRTVHLEKGPWMSEGGYEYNLVLLGVIAVIAADESGPALAVAQLAAGAAGSWAATAIAKPELPTQETNGASGG
jgi:putative oxidoreductase